MGKITTHAEALKSIRVADIGAVDFLALGRNVFHEPGRLEDPNVLRQRASYLLGSSLATALARGGWRFLYDDPGCPFAFQQGAVTLEPLTLVQRVLQKTIHRDEWQRLCKEAGIADVALFADTGRLAPQVQP